MSLFTRDLGPGMARWTPVTLPCTEVQSGLNETEHKV
jgi:hypothetical protein